ncbi:hypothetical protein RRG08_028876 [Elysia crispata]|uniref:Uncharacterized protein n=1 Tax=Elysia crispata TaxID=231223 RepID=A0AAE0YZ09_9GAST|nr:hypothetical protein RRG08_028876 [Elysia crispata]
MAETMTDFFVIGKTPLIIVSSWRGVLIGALKFGGNEEEAYACLQENTRRDARDARGNFSSAQWIYHFYTNQTSFWSTRRQVFEQEIKTSTLLTALGKKKNNTTRGCFTFACQQWGKSLKSVDEWLHMTEEVKGFAMPHPDKEEATSDEDDWDDWCPGQKKGRQLGVGQG